MSGRWSIPLTAALALLVSLATSVMVSAAPEMAEIVDQTIREGLLFAPIRAAELVSDPDYTFEELTWAFPGAVELQVLPYLDRLMIRVPDSEWSGSETIRFEVCNPAGDCVSREATFTVTEVNDVPVFERVPNQIIRSGERFEPVPIMGFATDVDHGVADLEWSVEGHRELDALVTDGNLTVSATSDDWIGAERLTLRVCDPASDCVEREVVFARIDDRAIALTLVQNAGFAIEAGGRKVLIDALLTQSVSPASQAAMRAAEPPFDVDLILITHRHSDHFNSTVVADNLRANPDAIVVSTPDVVDQIVRAYPEIDASRLIGVDLAEGEATVVEAAGLEITVYEIPHGPRIVNVGFLLRLGAWSVFHPGDVMDTLARETFDGHALAEAAIDIALVPWFLMTMPEYRAALTDGLAAARYVPMHITGGFARTCEGASAAFDNTLCFGGPLDVWVGFAND